MQIDRKTQRNLNAVIGSVLVVALSFLAWTLLSMPHRDRRPRPVPGIDLDVRDLVREGVVAERAGEFAKAEAAYRAALTKRGERVDLKLNLGRVLAAEGKRHEAWVIYEKLLEGRLRSKATPPGGPDALAWYADLAGENGKSDMGGQAAQAAVQAMYFPVQTRDVHHLLAKAHLVAARNLVVTMAFEWGHLRRATEIDPDWILPHLALSRLKLDAGNADEAETEYSIAQRKLARAPAEEWIRMARFQVSLESPDEAIQTLATAEDRIGRGNAKLWSSFLLVKVSLKTHFSSSKIDVSDRALTLIQQAARKDRPNTVGLALLIGLLGRKEIALQMLEEGMKTAKADERAHLETGLKNLEHPNAGSTTPPPDLRFEMWLGRELSAES